MRPKPITSTAPLAAVDSAARLSTMWHAAEQLRRGGATQRAAKAGRRIGRRAAARVGARPGKGHVGELDQVSSFTFRAGALQRSLLADVNDCPNDPVDDVFVRAPGADIGWQVKTVAQLSSSEASKYERIVSSAPVPASIAGTGPIIKDRLQHGVHEAHRLDAADMEEVAATAIEKELGGDPPVRWVEVFIAAFRAGGIDAVASAGLSLAIDFVKAWWRDRPFDWVNSSRAAIVHAVRTGSRTFLQTLLLARKFFERAGKKFDAGLAYAVGSLAILFGAIAEVAVEVVADVIELIKGRMTFDDLLKRALVHVATAAGAAVASLLAAAATANAPWWLQMAALVAAAAVGAYGGRLLGEAVVGPMSDEAALPVLGQ